MQNIVSPTRHLVLTILAASACACGGGGEESLVVAGQGDGGEVAGSGGEAEGDGGQEGGADGGEEGGQGGQGGASCKAGQLSDGEGDKAVCISQPSGDNQALALPEYVEGKLDGDTDVFNDAPVLTCAAETIFPRPPTGEGDASATVTVSGLLTKFGKAMEPQGLCVAILDHAKFMASDCAKQDNFDNWEACFAADLCANPGALGAGVVLGTTISTGHSEDAGRYEIPNIPVETNLVVRASGPATTWVDTYKYGIFIPAGEAALGTVEVEASIISKSSWQTVPATAMVPRGIQQGNGAIAGTVQDCGGAPDETKPCDPTKTCAPGAECDCEPGNVCLGEAGAAFCTRVPWSIVGATVGVSTRATNIAYFQGNEGDNLPAPGRKFTNILGTYAVIDSPGGPTELVAAATEDGQVQIVGRATIFMVPRSVAIFSFRGGWTGHFPWYI